MVHRSMRRKEWTPEELQKILDVRGKGVEAHAKLADELGVKSNTIYSTRKRIRDLGGVEAFMKNLERTEVSQWEKKPRYAETTEQQLAKIYTINVSNAGREGRHPQYSITIPSRVGEKFVEEFGLQVMFQVDEEGIKIIPFTAPTIKLPPWATHKKGDEHGRT